MAFFIHKIKTSANPERIESGKYFQLVVREVAVLPAETIDGIELPERESEPVWHSLFATAAWPESLLAFKDIQLTNALVKAIGL